MTGKDATDNNGITCQTVADIGYLLLAETHLQTIGTKALYNSAIVFVVEIFYDTLRHNLADTVNIKQLLKGSSHKCIDILKATCKEFRRGLADKTNAKSKDYTLERNCLRCLDALDNILCRKATVLVATRYLSHSEVVEVSHIVYKTTIPIFVNSLGT